MSALPVIPPRVKFDHRAGTARCACGCSWYGSRRVLEERTAHHVCTKQTSPRAAPEFNWNTKARYGHCGGCGAGKRFEGRQQFDAWALSHECSRRSPLTAIDQETFMRRMAREDSDVR